MPKILVVDDDKAATALFHQALMMNQYDVITLNESSKVLEVAAQELPDLIILDLMMPDPDGFKVCRMLRADPNLRRLPIIIVTALNDMDSRLVAIGAGANDYLVKPFHLDTLFNSVEKMLKRPTQTGHLPQS
jgi:two-component system, cell cycle response regulator